MSVLIVLVIPDGITHYFLTLINKQTCLPFEFVMVTYTLILIQAQFWVQGCHFGCKTRNLGAMAENSYWPANIK